MKAGGKEGQRGRGQGAEVQHGETEPENGSRRGKIGDWEAEREERERHREVKGELWGDGGR